MDAMIKKGTTIKKGTALYSDRKTGAKVWASYKSGEDTVEFWRTITDRKGQWETYGKMQTLPVEEFAQRYRNLLLPEGF
jgi:hypothetical protein